MLSCTNDHLHRVHAPPPSYRIILHADLDSNGRLTYSSPSIRPPTIDAAALLPAWCAAHQLGHPVPSSARCRRHHTSRRHRWPALGAAVATEAGTRGRAPPPASSSSRWEMPLPPASSSPRWGHCRARFGRCRATCCSRDRRPPLAVSRSGAPCPLHLLRTAGCLDHPSFRRRAPSNALPALLEPSMRRKQATMVGRDAKAKRRNTEERKDAGALKSWRFGEPHSPWRPGRRGSSGGLGS
ncbi:hypothetical protein U9M48_010488 [Paspalum notatum var. saurae]|uniref:Uncharacterized protein n=1 Tax=Paspalum notatum var. saurae TaxID=547442 RepID=A0AAQ3STJ8_PASNO